MAELVDPTEELNRAVERILASRSAKRLVVAGPGAGKTYLFKEILKRTPGEEGDRIALTFINELKDDLEKNLSGLAHAYTLHGFCHFLLRRQPELRRGLSDAFEYFPGIWFGDGRSYDLGSRQSSFTCAHGRRLGNPRDIFEGVRLEKPRGCAAFAFGAPCLLSESTLERHADSPRCRA